MGIEQNSPATRVEPTGWRTDDGCNTPARNFQPTQYSGSSGSNGSSFLSGVASSAARRWPKLTRLWVWHARRCPAVTIGFWSDAFFKLLAYAAISAGLFRTGGGSSWGISLAQSPSSPMISAIFTTVSRSRRTTNALQGHLEDHDSRESLHDPSDAFDLADRLSISRLTIDIAGHPPPESCVQALAVALEKFVHHGTRHWRLQARQVRGRHVAVFVARSRSRIVPTVHGTNERLSMHLV